MTIKIIILIYNTFAFQSFITIKQIRRFIMKLNILVLSTITLLSLTACGGGGGSSSSNSNTNENPSIPSSSFQQWSTFDLDSESDSLSYDSDTATIDNGKLYTSFSNDSFMVTAKGLYDEGPVHTTYGYLNGNISIKNNVWTLSPYSSINSSGLKITTTMKSYNIENESMASKVDPYNYWLLKNNLSDSGNYISNKALRYLTAISKVNFPAGSSCLQLNKVSNSEQYLELIDTPDGYEQGFLANWWSELSTEKDAKKYIMKDTIAYTLVDEEYQEEYGVAQYKNRFYDAYPSPKGVEFNMQDLIKSIDNEVNASTNATQKAQLLELKQLLESSCNFYNEVAIKAINQSFVADK